MQCTGTSCSPEASALVSAIAQVFLHVFCCAKKLELTQKKHIQTTEKVLSQPSVSLLCSLALWSYCMMAKRNWLHTKVADEQVKHWTKWSDESVWYYSHWFYIWTWSEDLCWWWHSTYFVICCMHSKEKPLLTDMLHPSHYCSFCIGRLKWYRVISLIWGPLNKKLCIP